MRREGVGKGGLSGCLWILQMYMHKLSFFDVFGISLIHRLSYAHQRDTFQHLKKFLMGPLSSHEPFIRSFDTKRDESFYIS